MNKKYKIIIMLLIVIIAISSYFLIKKFIENKRENEVYEVLQEIVQDDEDEENNVDNVDLTNIVKINSDVIGWIKIDGTNINYPVMQNGNYYLHRDIYKNYSSHGTPYLAEYCNLDTSDNLIIYGHNMRDKTMFSELINYKKYEFYSEYKYISFYTLEDNNTIENIYEIVFAFKTTTSGFKYYNYINFSDEQELNIFAQKCKELEFYSTGIEISYGDKLLTLSTCEYSNKNGRMVIVARKI